MSESTPEAEGGDPTAGELSTEEYGGLSIEDDPTGTVDPSDLSGTAESSDDEVVYAPEHHEGEDT